MSEWSILYSVKLNTTHSNTGNTKHTISGKEMQIPVELRIVSCTGTDGFYLFYCDDSGKEMTDTFHDTVELAMEQANFEFNVVPSEWSSIS